MRGIGRLAASIAIVAASLTGIVASAPVASAAPIDGSACNAQLRVIDISAYQPSINWSQLARGGVAGVYIKFTEGLGYTNPLAVSQVAGVESAALPWGGYDFASTSDNPIADADHFVAVGGANGTLPPVLDLEVSSLSGSATATWAEWWTAEVQRLVHRTPTLYTGSYYPWSGNAGLAAAYPSVWLASYPWGYSHIPGDAVCSVSGIQPNSTAWSGWSGWQFTSSGQIYGVSGAVDVSAFTPSWWAQATGGAVVPTNPIPTGGTNNYPAPSYGIGSSGSTVVSIQNELNFWQHAGLTVDGAYGPATANAVARWQSSVLHVTADGVWGPATKLANDKFLAAMSALAATHPAPSPTPPSPPTSSGLAAIHACTLTVIGPGSSGGCVKLAQLLLTAHGYYAAADGSDGPATTYATRRFQTSRGLSADALIGARTWAALGG